MILKSQLQPEFAKGHLVDLTLEIAKKLVEYVELEFTKGPVFAHYMLNHDLDVLFAE